MNAEQTAIFFVLLAYHLLHLLAEEERLQQEPDAGIRATLLAQATLDPEGTNDHG